jgi:Tol biopolymer transport system component
LLVSGTAGPNNETGIWVFSVAGGNLRKLRDDGEGASASPDGSRIAFANGKGDEVWMMAANGEEPRRIFGAEEGFFLSAVRWSPDGQRIAYLKSHVGSDKMQCAIETRRLNGGPPAVIVSDAKLCGRYDDFAWLTDGRIIYSLAEAPPNQYRSNLWELQIDPDTGKASGVPRRLTNWVDLSFFALSVTADGKRLAFVRRYDQSDVYVGRLQASGRLDTPWRLTLDDRIDFPGGWTRDGRAVLFYSDRGGNLDIYRQGIQDRTAEVLVEGPEEKRAPQLSPNGAWILYLTWPNMQGGTFPQSGHVMRVPVSGGAPEPVLPLRGYPGSLRMLRAPYNLTTRGYPDFHCPSAATRDCVLAEADQRHVIFYTFDPVQGRRAQVAGIEIEPSNTFWDLSPDGSRIAFTRYDEQSGVIRILPLPGGPTREIRVKGWTSFEAVAWSLDGRSLFVTSGALTGSRLLQVSPNGAVRVLHKADFKAERPILSPDGRYLALAEVTSESNAWMIDSF